MLVKETKRPSGGIPPRAAMAIASFLRNHSGAELQRNILVHPQNLATSPENSEALKESKTNRYNKTQIDFIERDLFGDEPGYCDIVFISQYNCQL